MNIPRYLWGLIAAVLLVFAFSAWLALHDRRVRETAELQAVIDAQNDSIKVYKHALTQLGLDLQAADNAYNTAKGQVVYVGRTPQTVKDSITKLEAALAGFVNSRDSMMPVYVAQQLDGQLRACVKDRADDSATAAHYVSECDRTRATRDSVIGVQTKLIATLSDQIQTTAKLGGLSNPRIQPYVGGAYSLRDKRYEVELGTAVRLFRGLNLTAAARFRDSLDVLVGAQYRFR